MTSCEASAPADASAHQSALAQLDALRETCGEKNGGWAVLQCVAICAKNKLTLPVWVANPFVNRLALVTEAHVLSLEEAFGSFWPPGTRIDSVRRTKERIRLIHAEVRRLVAARPSVAIDFWLFEEVGKVQGIDLGASRVSKLYYQGLDQGMPNVAKERKAARRAGNLPACA